MPDNFNQPPTPEKSPEKETVRQLREAFIEGERVLEVEGREAAKPYLNATYSRLNSLNRSSVFDFPPSFIWNPDGSLTESEFNELNYRRKKLSNAIGILTASGEIRHDLNEI